MMTETKNTKAFLNTEIPSDWDVKELGVIGELKNGINKEKEDFGFGFPMVNLMDVFGINKFTKTIFNLAW
jgi:type I restriction enzyme S subunit